MSGAPCRGSGPSRGGFTLIEVIGSLLIFSVGVIMVLQLTGALTRQMEYAAKSSELVARVQERLDSVEALPFDSVTVGTRQDTLTVRGTRYVQNATVTSVTGLLRRIDVSLTPQTTGAGPSYSATSYAASLW
ncbi:MAG: type IV pilus modification PilV family protein [Longimicrobiales bacterium]